MKIQKNPTRERHKKIHSARSFQSISHPFRRDSRYDSISLRFHKSFLPTLNGFGKSAFSLIQVCNVLREMRKMSITLAEFRTSLLSLLILISQQHLNTYLYQLIIELNNQYEKIIIGTYLQINIYMLQLVQVDNSRRRQC
jgi:hypothetical protein